jgi:hypothetical protein
VIDDVTPVRRVKPVDIPPVCLHPSHWMPPVLQVKPGHDPVFRAYREDNRVFRRAFGRGERHRKILLACGEAKLKGLES